MHVGVEASRLARETRGIGRYVRALLPELATADPSVRFTCFAKDRDDVAPLLAALDTMPFLSDSTTYSRSTRWAVCAPI